MATQDVAQPSAKKRKFLLRDLFKLCRLISKILVRDKPNHKAKHERHDNSKFHVSPDPPSFKFQETNKAEGASLCKVRSYRIDSADYVGSKKILSSLSRTCSKNSVTATTAASTTMKPIMRSLSFIGRSKSSNNRVNDSRVMPKLMRSTTTASRNSVNPILYSTSSARVVKPPPTEKKLTCTLEELCNGCP